jgi:ribonuclease HII
MDKAPSFAEEERLWEQGYRLVAGIDEAGRGPLAGPVVAAAVILPCRFEAPWLNLVRDSKQLTPGQREFLFNPICEEAVAWAVGTTAQEIIDDLGIMAATRLAMASAVAQLPQTPQHLLIDALLLPRVHLPQTKLIRGDSLCLSIAAASILAKVTRDRLMVQLDNLYPGYGFARHKGYGTREHIENLRCLGPCPIHRKNFKRVRDLFSGI